MHLHDLVISDTGTVSYLCSANAGNINARLVLISTLSMTQVLTRPCAGADRLLDTLKSSYNCSYVDHKEYKTARRERKAELIVQQKFEGESTHHVTAHISACTHLKRRPISKRMLVPRQLERLWSLI